MIKQKAIGLLKDTFNQNFEINKFSKFTKELLNEFTLNVQNKPQIAHEYKDYEDKVMDFINKTEEIILKE